MRTLLLFLSFSSLYSSIRAEGSKEIRPLSLNNGYIQVYDNNTTSRPFATYSATANERLYIHIATAGEKIYYGFQQTNNDVYYRIKNPSGTTVVGPTLLPAAGAGRITTHAQAILGPSAFTLGGYSALSYTTTMAGDYYIEFNPLHATTINATKRVFDLFDITVSNAAATQVIKGRVWSKAWDFTTNGSSNTFVGNLYIYSNSGIVTSVNMNAIQPYGFVVSCNGTGCANTGDPIADRQSRAGNSTYADYKIFLNNPDSTSYPSGVLGTINGLCTYSGCGPYCINVPVSAPGLIEVSIELNGVPGYQSGSSDIYIAQNALTAGSICIPWDGKNGLGVELPALTVLTIHVDYKFGLTHLPLYDVENHTLGYIVSSVRPAIITPKLFWDDSQLAGGGTELNGCITLACHSWPSSNFGDNRTINTWWYANIATADIIGIKPVIPATVIQQH